LHNSLLHNYKFGQAHGVELLNRIHTKFTLQILVIPSSFYKFWKFKLFSANIHCITKFKKRNKKKKDREWVESGPRPKAYQARRPTVVVGRHGLVARLARGHTTLARGTVGRGHRPPASCDAVATVDEPVPYVMQD
jgi:hypothetical protein